MHLNFRKTALLVGMFSAFGLNYALQLSAASVDAIAVVQQSKKITGTVTDGAGPVIGANVLEKGTTNGVITDIEGNFTLNVRPGATIIISFIGYKSQEIVVGNQSMLKVLLKDDSEVLDEVVVVGYGVQKKKLVTGATVEVKGDDITKLNTTQALGALQSQSPGVNIQAVSGQPGDGFKVTIRGAGTNGNAAPIYVIDGVAGGDINAINPADIERIDVLKDAASCAIYGSSGANGVILITTKQGKEGKIQVTYDGNIGWQNVYKMPDLLDAKQYMAVMDQVEFARGGTPFDWSKYIDADLLKSYQDGTNKGTNWVEEMRNKNAVVTNHAFNLAGGTDLSKFSTGVGYQYQDGVFGGPVKSDFRRFTFRLNSEHIIYKKGNLDVIKIGENIYYQHRQTQGIQIGNQYSNNLSNALRGNPLIQVRNKDGEYVDYDDLKSSGTDGWFAYNMYSSNPIANMVWGQSGNNQSKSFNLSAIGFVEIQPIKNLVYRGQVSYKQYSSSWRCYLPEYYINDNNDSRLVDQTIDNVSLGWNWNTTNTLTYKFNIAQDHHFDVLAGTEYSKSRPNYGETVNVTGYENIFGDFAHGYLDNTKRSGAYATGAPAGYGASMSYFGRVNYDYNETYMLTAIIRADGSSNFAKGHRWGYFPSVSLGWVASNEEFMAGTRNWLDFLKIRAGWGQNGNANIPNLQWKAGYDFGAYGMYSFDNNKNGGTQGGYPNRLANEGLTWETSEQTNIGFDARFLNSRLNVTMDWYNKKTKDLLLPVQVSAITGFPSMYGNAGTVKNTGVETTFGWNDKVGKDFSYGANVNFAFNKNEVTEVNAGADYVEGGNDLLSQGTGIIARMWEGHPIGCFYGYKTEGVMQNASDVEAYLKKNCKGTAANSLQGGNIKPGDLKFVDVNGDGVVNANDKTEIGSPHPDFTMGISLNAAYKGFDISVTTYGAFGQEVARSYRKFADGQFENYTTEVYEYWHGEGTSNRYPMLAPGSLGRNWQEISDIYIDDASYFRIQNVTIGYDFKKLWKSCPFQQLRVYAAAQNLYTFTGYKGMDPENGMALNSAQPWITGVDVGNYPQPRTYMFGVNVKF
ncbi:TonB-dependent receptor [Bacteroidaceae bacterium HV4-6-C5C]|nr:TonB-dependent receptor [Bacteroidaceae bacterium HV4-6-C5C]